MSSARVRGFRVPGTSRVAGALRRAAALVAASCAWPVAAAGQGDSLSSGSSTITAGFPSYNSLVLGIEGGTTTLAACPAGRMVVGAAGTRHKFVSRVTPICASLNKDGSVASAAPLDPSAVGPNAAGFNLQCAAGRVVTGIRVAYHDNASTYPYLGGVEVSCSRWTVGQWATPPQPLATTGFEGWPRKASAVCPRMTQPVRGLRVRATTSVKALGIVCDELF